jgi:hypothetical protein
LLAAQRVLDRRVAFELAPGPNRLLVLRFSERRSRSLDVPLVLDRGAGIQHHPRGLQHRLACPKQPRGAFVLPARRGDPGEVDHAVGDEERVLDFQCEPQRLVTQLLGPLEVPGARLDATQIREFARDGAPVPNRRFSSRVSSKPARARWSSPAM